MALGGLAHNHLLSPRNTGDWPAEAAELPRVAGEAGSVVSGAFVRFQLALDSGRIAAVRYEVLGGPALLAATSWLSERLTGEPAAENAVPAGLDMAHALELERADHGMALLAEDAVLRALNAVRRGPIFSDKT